MIAAPVHASGPGPNELARAKRWAEAKFAGKVTPVEPKIGFRVVANNDPVQRNRRNGGPLNLAGKTFASGLYCHANSDVEIRLPGPAKSFHAVVGVDSNEQTSGGRGSVVFAVRAGDRELFRSPLLREGDQPVTVDVPLGGAAAFHLQINDGGDGISCDQSDWADASVLLADGKTLRLGDLTEIGEPPAIDARPEFSFVYGGKPSAGLLASWPTRRTSRELDPARTQYEQAWTDPATGLEVRRKGILYRDFPTVEWTVELTNRGAKPTPIVEAIRGLDASLASGLAGDATLHYQRGSVCEPIDYEPLAATLKPGEPRPFAPRAGRGTDPWMPYFNLEWPRAGRGALVVVGWPGQWAAEFTAQPSGAVAIRAGQELTHLSLRPGETIRTPLMVLQFYEGDWLAAQNVWRRWMTAHNLPRPGGKAVAPQLAACSSWQFGEMIHANDANQKMFIDRYDAEGIRLDYWWMDAGWYVQKTGWPETGTWEVDLARFPGGLRSITDHAHAKGIRSIVWFEPERVAGGTWLATEHPGWILGGKAGGLLDLGNPDALRWLTEHVDGLIVGQGIDLYRQDFNIDPLDYWRKNDASDRRGATENHHIQGYLAYWDELRRRHPGMLIDSCASGGRRNDLETMRRSVPLLRSDYLIEPEGQQGHTYGVALWLPFYGTAAVPTSRYGCYSQVCPHVTVCLDMRQSGLNLEEARRNLSRWTELRTSYLADYYPLTPYDRSPTAWMAWQFDVPEQGRGHVQAFRHGSSPYETARLPLRGLDSQATYSIRDLDRSDPPRTFSGTDLMDRGLSVTIDERPGAVILEYSRVR
ncbi:NPCBM/NEW2 domain-containing protein [Aquisphaera insulae]|uniref:NPCBM/NEW2 domain-containing protein n=1 Tax=Aquisphaera insulae TaxID=2712864 RepID=UPI0013EBD0F9|nr:NPCBM/NEW2 domain-containing protein [Aquisphaera insulae]